MVAAHVQKRYAKRPAPRARAAKRKILIQYSRRLIEVPGSGNELQPAVNDPDARACACKTGDKKFDLIRRSARRVF
jgi:hypothetical protein